MSAPAPVSPTIDAGRCRARTRPARATRIGTPPRPRVRPLGDVLVELVRATPATGVVPGVAPVPAAVPVAAAARPPRPEDPATRAVVVRLLQAVVEVLDRARPVAHLQQACGANVDPDAVLAHVVPPGSRWPRSRLRGVRLCAVAPGAVEVAGVVHRGSRARAVVARLEHDGRTWRFAVLTIL